MKIRTNYIETAADIANRGGRQLNNLRPALVVTAGLMDRTVKVRLWNRRWENHVSKWFAYPTYHLVHDPANSVRSGDVINISSGWRESQHKRHIVRSIVSPCGPPIHERNPVPSESAIYAMETKRRNHKLERRRVRDRKLIREWRRIAQEKAKVKKAAQGGPWKAVWQAGIRKAEADRVRAENEAKGIVDPKEALRKRKAKAKERREREKKPRRTRAVVDGEAAAGGGGGVEGGVEGGVD